MSLKQPLYQILDAVITL